MEEGQVDQVDAVPVHVDVDRALPAAQTAFAWVCTTAFGRDVVPDVYMIPTGAIGSASRFGQSAASPSRVEGHGIRGRRWISAPAITLRIVVGDDDPLEPHRVLGHDAPRIAAGSRRRRIRRGWRSTRSRARRFACWS